MEKEDEKNIYEKYMKPKKDLHTRIGTSYQAKIPSQESNINDKGQHTIQTHVHIEQTISDEFDEISKPNKKRRLDI